MAGVGEGLGLSALGTDREELAILSYQRGTTLNAAVGEANLYLGRGHWRYCTVACYFIPAVTLAALYEHRSSSDVHEALTLDNKLPVLLFSEDLGAGASVSNVHRFRSNT
jgi:hypothetical protein